MDWKDMLQGLREDLPEGTPSPSDDHASEGATMQGDTLKKDTLHIAYERKGRGGKQATIIYGFSCPDDELKEVARQLKQKTGVGGSSRGGEILLQGDLRAQLPTLLHDLGYKTK